MFKKIISTIFTRTLLAVMTFALAIITTRYLGPAGKGDVSLFVLNLTIVQLVNNFVGGSYMVYLIPRKNFMQLFLLSYVWSLFTAAAIPCSLYILNLIDIGQIVHLVIISFLYSLFAVNTMIFIGKEQIGIFNIVSLLQTSVLIVAFLFYLEYFEIKNVASFISAMYFSSGISFVFSFIFIIKYIEKISLKNIIESFYETIRGGFIMQAGNIAQMFNYRLSYYILDNFYAMGRKEVGIYSVAVSVAEALWLISQSVALVLYSRISNSNDLNYSRKLTIALVKFVFVCTILCTGVLLCFPSSIFEFVFGEGFSDVKPLLFPLSGGIIMLSSGIILSSYFVGIGKLRVSVIGSAIGLAVTIGMGFFLIPLYGKTGAAITATLSYTSSVIYQFSKFFGESKELTLRDFIFTKNDFAIVFSELKYIFSSK